MRFNKFLSCFLAAVMALQNSQAIFAGEEVGVNKSFALSSLMVAKNKGLCVSSENPNEDLSCYDKYVKVIDNKYVLEFPENVTLSNYVIAKIQQQIDLSNKLISMENLQINPYTKSAVIMGKCTNGEGITSVEFYWNYVHVNIATPILRIILPAGVSGAETTIMSVLNVTSTVALGITGAIWGTLSGIIGEYVNDGVWLNYNYFYRSVTEFGLQ